MSAHRKPESLHRKPANPRKRHARNAVLGVLATLGLALGGTVAMGASSSRTATCTHHPVITQTKTAEKITTVCKIPNHPRATATVTKTVTASPKPSPSTTPSTEPSTQPTSTAPTTSPTSAPPTSDPPTTSPTSAPPLSGSLYEPGSYFYSAPGPVDQAATAAMQKYLASTPDQPLAYPQLTGVGSNKWGMVYAQASSFDPLWKLTGSVPATVAAQLSSRGFHAPSNFGSQLTGTSDSPFIVDDEATRISVWAAGASLVSAPSGTTPGVIHVTAAGYFEHGTNGLDRRNPASDSTVNEVSRGRIPDTMVVTAHEFATAKAANTGLGHVLEIFWPATGGGHRSPMVGDEGNRGGWGEEGQRIAISPSVNLASRNCTPTALVIARTLQQNGAYIGDNAGGGATIKMEQNSSADPVWAGVKNTELNGCVTWADFVATS